MSVERKAESRNDHLAQSRKERKEWRKRYFLTFFVNFVFFVSFVVSPFAVFAFGFPMTSPN